MHSKHNSADKKLRTDAYTHPLFPELEKNKISVLSESGPKSRVATLPHVAEQLPGLQEDAGSRHSICN